MGPSLDWLGWPAGPADDAPTWVAIQPPPCRIEQPRPRSRAPLQQPERLRPCLTAVRRSKGGGVRPRANQHWPGALPGPTEVPLLACPSIPFCAFEAVQPCPPWTPRAESGGRWLELGPDWCWAAELLRWSAPP